MNKQYQQEIQEIQAELKQLPKGYLVKRRSFYYCHDDGKDRGITKDPQMIAQLARKAYLKERLKRLTINAKAAMMFDKRYRELSSAEIIRELSNPYKDLPQSYFFRDFANSWGREDYEKNDFCPEDRHYLTNGGVLVRSKSEMLIANALERKHISYRYEAALKLGESVYYPDFTAKRHRGGKLIFWEHFGLLDRPDYAVKTAEKLNTYAKHHIFPGRDLICTCEADIEDSRKIDAIIDLYFTDGR
ncbi:hypothetical protein NE619_13630 [Anaerovorax odorimutans]|uniref:ATPase n=1 Tax=Anaerovorax odorimutans TaxID=109327 RepID=A0ABT1RRE5_9FIRM|nr:hypothetical protein [Anaerovorax odorimutans]MCQ4637770.1 hypothetical protein [Anaerovorax odorimutans]